MVRRAARVLLACGLIATLVGSLWQAVGLARDPLFAPLAERGAAEIVAATDRMMAQEATAERLRVKIAGRLAEEPRNWIAIRALEDIAVERCVFAPLGPTGAAQTACPPLPEDLAAAREAAWAQDDGLFASIGGCAACAWNPARCTLSNMAICQLPVALTVLGDVAGVARAGLANATGADVDELDLGLSVVGLAATGLAIGSGGASLPIKAGAGMARLAHGMGLLTPRLATAATDALLHGIDWAALPAARSSHDLARAVRVERLAPLLSAAADMGRVRDATGTGEALHLLRYVDDATDARRLAHASEALRAKTVGRVEVLGKGRVLRATLRLSDAGWRMAAALIAAMVSLATILGGMAQAAGLRILRRLAREGAGPAEAVTPPAWWRVRGGWRGSSGSAQAAPPPQAGRRAL